MPVFNVKKYLCKSVESVLNQSYKNLELILIDDGSFDGSEHECDLFVQKDSRVRVVHQINSGVSSARNKGLSVANGEFISFVDSDDIIDPCFIELMWKKMLENDVDLVRLAWERGGKDFSYNVPFDDNDQFVVSLSNIKELSYFANIWGLFRSECLKNIVFDEKLKYAEDHLFVFEYFLKSPTCKMLLVNKPFYHYTVVGNSATHINPVTSLKFSSLFVDKILSLSAPYPKVVHLAKMYHFQACLKALFYLKKHELQEQEGVSVDYLNSQILMLRTDGCRETTLASSIVSFLYRHNLNVVVRLLRKLSAKKS